MVSDRDFSHIRWAPFARPSTGTSRGRIPVSGQDGRTGTRDPGDGVVADDARPSVLDLKLGLDGDARIVVVQPELSQAVTRVMRPSSTANGATAVVRLPQLPL
jgi:hypothetical protein